MTTALCHWRQAIYNRQCPSGVFLRLVPGLVFKTSGGWDDCSQWVRFPYTPAIFFLSYRYISIFAA